jgi:prepilin-type N-terminal cleavage/methylation domain-containing protein
VRRAFTLIELIVVIVVLAILAGVAIPRYMNQNEYAKTAKLQDYLGKVRSAVAQFRLKASVDGAERYPTWQELCTQGTVLDGFATTGSYMYSGSSFEFFVNPFNNAPGIFGANTGNITQIQAAAGTIPTSASSVHGWVYFLNNSVSPPVFHFYSASPATTTVPNGSGGYKAANEL